MIARQSTLVTANNVLGAAQGFLALFVVARYMGDEVYGSRAFAMALVAIVGLVARLGLPTTHVRRLARGEDVAASNGAFLALKLVLVGSFAALGLLAGWIYFGILGKAPTDTTPEALWIAFAVILIQGIRDVPVHSFQGLRMIVEREAVLFTNTIATVALTALAAIAYAASHGRWSPIPWLGESATGLLGITQPLEQLDGLTLVMVATLVAEGAALALAVVLFAARRIPITWPQRLHVADYIRFTIPLMLLSLGEVITKWMGQAAVGLFGTAADAGHYAAAAKLTEGLLLVPLSLAVVLLPAASRLHLEGRDSDAARLARLCARAVSATSWPVIAVLATLTTATIHILLSDAFLPAAWPLRILALQGLLAGILIPMQSLAVGLGKTRHAARAVLWSLVATATLDAILVPESLFGIPMAGWGPTGAAVAALLGTGLAVFLYVPKRGDWPGHDLALPHVARHAVAAIGAGIAMVLMPNVERFTALIGSAVLGLAVYAVVLAALGEIDRSALRQWRRTLRSEP